MRLLGAALYDPAVAVSKATSALLAMTAVDTVNLRLAITVPAHGKVFFRLRCTLTGATTYPVILLGVLNGATVLGRVTPTDFPGTANAASQTVPCVAEFTASGLAAGAMNVDAAYAVQVLLASTSIKYGGPNTSAGANAWGGFLFEAWDPDPWGAAQTPRDLGAQLDAAVSSRMATYAQPAGFLAATFPVTVASPTNITAGTITTVTNLTNAAAAGDFTAVMKASITAAATAATPTAAAVTGAVGSVTAPVALPAIPANWITAAGIAAGALNGKGDWLLASGYTAPPSAAAIRAEMDANSLGLAAIFARTDVATSSRLATAGYAAPDNASVAAIKAKTDSLAFTLPGLVDVQVLWVNGKQVTGLGTLASPWKAP